MIYHIDVGLHGLMLDNPGLFHFEFGEVDGRR
jgi:hypothetical protein